jgi:hypothetical protein
MQTESTTVGVEAPELPPASTLPDLSILAVMPQHQLDELLEEWGNAVVDSKCTRELTTYFQDKTHASCTAWLEQKALDNEAISIKQLALLSLLHNKSLILMEHVNNEAISIDIEGVITKVQAMQSKIEGAEKFDMQKFESELDALCVEPDS